LLKHGGGVEGLNASFGEPVTGSAGKGRGGKKKIISPPAKEGKGGGILKWGKNPNVSCGSVIRLK